MKKLLNTLYVTTQGSYLSKKGDTVLVSQDRETKLRVPIHNLDSIVCFGELKGGTTLNSNPCLCAKYPQNATVLPCQ